MEDNHLAMAARITDYRGATDFRTGSGGGRYRDNWRNGSRVRLLPVVAQVLESADWQYLASHVSDGLSGIEGTAAANSDHTVVSARLELSYTGIDLGGIRIAFDATEHPCLRQVFYE